MTIKRTMNAALFNAVCNHPEVRPWLPGEGPIDVTPVLSNPGNYGLFAEGGGFILEARPAASYEVHSQFVPEGRRHSFKAMRAGMDYMFTRTNALQLTTFIPDNNPAARGLAIKGGFRDWFRREATPLGPGFQARIEIDDWIANTPALEKDGERFHGVIEDAKAGFGSQLADHPEDKLHDRYAGASLLMCERGQMVKAEALYNRWAANAGYTPIRRISDAPPLMDVGEGVLVALGTDGLEVLQCP